MIVDAHAHISTPDVSQYPTGPVGGHELDPKLLENTFTAEQLIATLHDEPTSHAIIVQRSHMYGYDNRYVVDSARAHPDLLIAVVAIDARADDAEERLDYWVTERGAKGIRLNYPGRLSAGQVDDLSWLSGDNALRMWAHAARLQVPVCLHFLRANREPAIAALARIVSEIGDVTVVVDHAANCAVEEGPPDFGLGALREIDRPNVTFKIAPINFRYLRQAELQPADFVRSAVSLFGADRVLFGSDVTNSVGTHAELMNSGVESASQLTDEERDQFLGGTAARVYGIS